uniref:GTP-binding protein TrmE N-terminus n=1 Tax=virus sp. ctBM815 TaxID=2825806 RepID=A0A8S5RKM2_9VIRU|nr:MAG TPA: GTP-binding protein TrmE N-terminus [virus sp. ctBM815]DAG45383.1 MAG TPA: GTP-binding protein TrmE N-terminus [Caudoviricetes sp.]
MILWREHLSIGKIEQIILNFLLHRENRVEIMLHGGTTLLDRLVLILDLL